MLSIGKLVAGQEAYYDLQVGQGRDDYYTGRGEAPGRWTGAAASRLGLSGDVDSAGFSALLEGRHPSTGERLRSSRGNQKVAAYDLTFSAPKSVSVLFAIAESEVRGALVEAHEEAVDAAVEYIEAEAVRVRRGRDGIRQLVGGGLVSAAYRHRMSRAEDPQLHTHVVTANLTRGADGRWSALHGHLLYRHAKAAGTLYEAHLRAAVRERLPWVEWGPVHKGIADIEGIPSSVLKAFSQRRAQIEEWLAAEGREGRRSAEKAALATRRAKAQYGVDTGTWSEVMRARAGELGLGAAELAELERREPVEHATVDERALAASLSGPHGLTEMRNTFEERHAIVEYAAAHRQGATVPAVRGHARRYLGREDVVAIDVPDEPRYTTESLLECEKQIVAGAQGRRDEGAGVLDGGTVDEVLRALPVALNDDQDAVVRAVALGGHGVEAVEALAGTGKTTMAAALGAVYRRGGYRVLGVAPTGRAARELAERGIESWTAHRLAGDLEYGGGFAEEPTVLFYDEAGMAPTRESAEIFAAAEQAGVKVVAIGDSGQLTSVQAGGWLGALSKALGAHELRQVVRQHDPDEEAALSALHDGRSDAYIDHKLARGELEAHSGLRAAETAAVDGWQADVDEVGLRQAVMVARDNDTRRRLNDQARAWLADRGALGADVEIGGQAWGVGERVIARRNDRFRDVDNGTRGTVVAVDRRGRSITVETDAGALRELDREYVEAHIEPAYALTGHGSQGATLGRVHVVGTPEDFTAEWAYTALSRARETTTLHMIAERRDRAGRSEIAPDEPGRDDSEALSALRAAMARSEREDLALQQLDEQATAHVLPDVPEPKELARRRAPAAVDAEAAAARLERDAQRRVDEQPAEPVAVPAPPRALRRADPLPAIRAAVGPELVDAVDVDEQRASMAERHSEDLRARAEVLRPVSTTFPHDPADARKHARQAGALDQQRANARAALDTAREEAESLGRLERRRRRDEFTRRIDQAQARVDRLDNEHADLQAQVDDERAQTDTWLLANRDALAELVALETELADRTDSERHARIVATLREPPDPILQRLGPRPDDPAAREAWDQAAAHLSDYEHGYGHPPEDQPPRGGQRRRAWEEVQASHADALERSPDAPADVITPAPEHDPGPDLGL